MLHKLPTGAVQSMLPRDDFNPWLASTMSPFLNLEDRRTQLSVVGQARLFPCLVFQSIGPYGICPIDCHF